LKVDVIITYASLPVGLSGMRRCKVGGPSPHDQHARYFRTLNHIGRLIMSTSKLPVWLIAMMNSRPATNAALTAPLSALPTVAKCCEVGISHTKGGQHQGPLPTTSF